MVFLQARRRAHQHCTGSDGTASGPRASITCSPFQGSVWLAGGRRCCSGSSWGEEVSPRLCFQRLDHTRRRQQRRGDSFFLLRHFCGSISSSPTEQGLLLLIHQHWHEGGVENGNNKQGDEEKEFCGRHRDRSQIPDRISPPT